MQVKSITQLREKKEIKKEQIEYAKTRLHLHWNQLDSKRKNANWLGKLLWGIGLFKQGKKIVGRIKDSRH
jgi:hypothetical protein